MDRVDTAERGESELGSDALRVVARSDEEFRGDVTRGTVFGDQSWDGEVDEFVERGVVGVDLIGEV